MPLISTKTGELVLFMHIPKTGGTTIEECFNGRNILFSGTTVESCFEVNAQHFDSCTVDSLGLRLIASRSFAVVRNPYDRIMSEYNHFHRARRFRLSFAAFLIYISYRYRMNKFCFDNHIRPQSDFVFDDTSIYRFEDGFEEIINKIKLSYSIEQVKPLRIYNKRSLVNDVIISDAEIRRINELYKDDFHRFGYEVKGRCERKFLDSILELGAIVEALIKVPCDYFLRRCYRRAASGIC